MRTLILAACLCAGCQPVTGPTVVVLEQPRQDQPRPAPTVATVELCDVRPGLCDKGRRPWAGTPKR